MKYLCLFAVICALSLAGSASSFGAEPVTVTMKSLSYDPQKLEVHVGDSVVWVNNARTIHTATSDDEGKTFDTGEVEAGKTSKAVKFDKVGEFKYHCKVHGQTMSGTIVVKGP